MKTSNKLERFDSTLNDLEKELEQLQHSSEAYKKLYQLTSSYKTVIIQLEESSAALQRLVENQAAKHQELKTALNEISEENKKSHESLQALNHKGIEQLRSSVNKLKTENQQFHSSLEQSLQSVLKEHHNKLNKTLDALAKENRDNHISLKQLNQETAKDLDASVDKLRTENRQFYTDFEKVVRIKLEEHKSEIKRFIEDEHSRLKQLFEDKIEAQSSALLESGAKTRKLILTIGIVLGILLIAGLSVQFL